MQMKGNIKNQSNENIQRCFREKLLRTDRAGLASSGFI